MVDRRTMMKVALSGVVGSFLSKHSHAAQSQSAFDFSFPALDGGTIQLKGYAGKAVLVVNTASQCGFTKQYEGLEKIWKTYQDQGLVVLGVPCNDFGGQEPGSAEEIADFCTTTFDVSFPMTGKTHVIGDQAHPFYKWARSELGAMAAPKWNFHKYLVDQNGQLIDWFSTITDPMSDKVQAAVKKTLSKA